MSQRRTLTDFDYAYALDCLLHRGDLITTRNAETRSVFGHSFYFTQLPLVTLRKTAWKKALREMEWFMTGDPTCPEDLQDWWAGQLSPAGSYYGGYGSQLRASVGSAPIPLDQVQFALNVLKSNPNSRRIVLTTWNSSDMSLITETNSNDKTPTNCHGTVIQLIVRNGEVHMIHFQRSADVLLGLPHNFVQYWALLTYLAHHSGHKVGTLRYHVGDMHLYNEESHLKAAAEMVGVVGADEDWVLHNRAALKLNYIFSGEYDEKGVPVFKAADFIIEGEIAGPVTNIRPRLL